MASSSLLNVLGSLLAAGCSLASASATGVQPRDPVPSGYVAADYYPAPYGGWTADWNASYAKAQALVSKMTLAEKTNITAGTGYIMGPCVGNTGSAPRVGFPQLCLQDSALGIAMTDHNTAFPAGITTGATWDKDLMSARAEAIGAEFRGKGANVYLGPTVGPIGRKPRGGRNWEGFGADPVLQAVGAGLTVKGVQSQGVIATVKHLIGNEQEMYRMFNPVQSGYSANIDDRTLHELYLWPFAEAVRAGVGAVMTAYNAVNGSACSQNSYLINGILKDELGFQGFVMSDWLAQMSGVDAAIAGLDMGMPGDTQIPLLGTSYFMYALTQAVLNGSVPMDRVDDMATRVVATWYQMGQDKDFDLPNFSSWSSDAEGYIYPAAQPDSPKGVINQFVDVQGSHAEVARQVAQDAVTLLKNDDAILPLSNSTKLWVFGSDAQVNSDGANACGSKACDKGTLGMGWGSGTVNYPYLDDPADGDIAIVFINSDSGENSFTVEDNPGDRRTSGLSAWHNGDKLVQDVAAWCKNVIVVVHTVGPIIVEPWNNLTSVKAVVFAHLPGQEAGKSLANVLYGDVAPSGHLPYSIPVSESDYPDSVGLLGGDGIYLTQIQDTFSEGLYIDYRHLNKQGIKPRYAFGHGLSYTTFSMSNATIKRGSADMSTATPAKRPAKGVSPAVYSTTAPGISDVKAQVVKPDGFDQVWRYIYSWVSELDAWASVTLRLSGLSKYPYPPGYSTTQKTGDELPPAGGAEGGNAALYDEAFALTVTVDNTGDFKNGARAVAQAYVQFPEEVAKMYDTPVIQLRDFAKTDELKPGGSATLKLSLTRKDISVWDATLQNWVVPSLDGRFTIWIGEASDKLFTACYTDTLTCEYGLKSPV